MVQYFAHDQGRKNKGVQLSELRPFVFALLTGTEVLTGGTECAPACIEEVQPVSGLCSSF